MGSGAHVLSLILLLFVPWWNYNQFVKIMLNDNREPLHFQAANPFVKVYNITPGGDEAVPQPEPDALHGWEVDYGLDDICSYDFDDDPNDTVQEGDLFMEDSIYDTPQTPQSDGENTTEDEEDFRDASSMDESANDSSSQDGDNGMNVSS